MTNLLAKTQYYFTRILKYFLKGEFSLVLYVFAQKLPNWLFCFNKATILCTKNFIFPEKFNPDVKVTIASYSDIDEINRISGVQSIHIKEMMDSGAKCFMASIKDEPPSSVTWSANRKTYVRGLAFLHDIGTNGYYSFGSITLPNARGKGIYLKAKCEKIKYEMSKGAEKFYGTIEFTNTYSYSLQEKLGYQPTIKLTYVKMLFMKICIVKDISTGKFSIRIIVREPKGNIIII